jgi:chitinase
MKKITIILYTLFTALGAFSQLPEPAMVGYWENWNGANKFVALKDVDPLYNVICIAFTANDANYDVSFDPYDYSDEVFKSEIKTLQDEGRKILISIGGANGALNITSESEKDIFVASVNEMIDYWGFDGLDIDLEGEESLNFEDIKIGDPGDDRQVFLIEGLREILDNHKENNGERLLLTMAPETMYVHGALSPWDNEWNKYKGAYLPIIEAFKEDIDMMNVQLYNSGSMYGLDGSSGGEFTQGTSDWVLALTEAVILGFQAEGGIGKYSGLPANKVGVALPGCHSSDAVPHDELQEAMAYLLGNGDQPGDYVLKTEGGYPDLKGMMTWSINSDRTCSPSYGFAKTFSKIFLDESYLTSSIPEVIYEGQEDQGVIEIVLHNSIFSEELNIDNWDVTPLAEGVTVGAIDRVSNNVVHVVLAGNSSEAYDSYFNELTFTIDAAEMQDAENSLETKIIVVQKSPLSVPSLVEAEYFYEASVNNVANVAIAGFGTATCIDVRTAYNNKMTYSIDVDSAEEYELIFHFSSSKGTVNLSTKVDGKSVGTKYITTDKSFQNYVYDTVKIDLEEGEHSIEFDLTKHWMYLNSIQFKKSSENSPVTALNGTKSNNAIQFYPNPTSESIRFSNDQNREVKIFDNNGKLVSETILESSQELDVSKLKPGMYILQTRSADNEIRNNSFIKK